MGVSFDAEARKSFRQCLETGLTDEDKTMVMFAYRLALLGHAGQERDGGGPFADHPIRVARILAEEFDIIDRDMLIAALLHDVIEDAHPDETWVFTWKSLRTVFGDRVHDLVFALTKAPGETRSSYFQRVAQASSDARLIKLADRLDNLREIHSCTPDKQGWYLRETRTALLPLAHRTNTKMAARIADACRDAETRLLNGNQTPAP